MSPRAPDPLGPTARRLVGVAVLVLAVLFLVITRQGGSSSPQHPTATPSAHGSGSVTIDARSGLHFVSPVDLPPQARHTMDVIREDGPFPYREDGSVFGNYEGLLPKEPHGYYFEYTVQTPGSPDRGARRIIAGRDGTLYYTDDHYASFRTIGP